MISSRRQTHRWLMTALAVLLPWLAVSALLQRPEIPPVTSTAAPLFARSDLGAAEGEGDLLVAFDWPVQGTRLKGQLVLGETLQLSLIAEQPLNLADPLLYWSSTAGTTESLAQAQLLGSLAGAGTHRYRLPVVALHTLRSSQSGLLLLVSPLDQRIVASWELPPFSVGGERS